MFGPQAPVGRPKMFVSRPRRDGRVPVTFAYANGVRIKKLLTAAALDATRATGSYIEVAA